MKKFLLVFCGLAMFVLLYAQERAGKSAQQILMSKTWHFGDNRDIGCRFVFSRDSITFYYVGLYGYDDFGGKRAYYLSNKKDDFFDDSKVGKSQEGTYLIEKSSISSGIECSRIVNINNDQVELEVIGILGGEKKNLIYNAVR